MRAVFSAKEPANKSDAVTFHFKVDSVLNFTAGQFTELSLREVGKHWFTISSAPGSNEFTITTRLTGSDFKEALNSLNPGDEVDVAEPMGDFVLPIDQSTPILMVAGGIGITPFLSILKDLPVKAQSYHLNVIYAAKSEADFVDLSPYSRLLDSYEKVVGQLDVKEILNAASALKDPFIYVSGPEPLVEALVASLRAGGISEHKIVADYFPGYQ